MGNFWMVSVKKLAGIFCFLLKALKGEENCLGAICCQWQNQATCPGFSYLHSNVRVKQTSVLFNQLITLPRFYSSSPLTMVSLSKALVTHGHRSPKY